MGNKCVSGCAIKTKKNPLHSLVPEDIDKFKPQSLDYTLPKILFQAQIFNIQIINCPEGPYSLNFQIPDVNPINLPEKQIEKKPKNNNNTSGNQLQWKTHQKFAFAMTEYEIRSRFLTIEIFGQRRNKINELVVNLYMIATGPQHHDLEVKLAKDKFSRLKFDFKISQVVQVSINIDQIKLQFDEDLEDQQIDYSFKIIRNNEVVSYAESQNPKFVKSPFQKNLYRQTTLDDQCKSPLKFRRTTNASKMIKRDLKSSVQWGEGQKKDTSLMPIAAKLLSNDINKSFLYFLVWKFTKKQGTEQNRNNKDDWNLFAGALINFNKIFQKPKFQKKIFIDPSLQTECSTANQRIGFDIEERQMFIEQPLWGEDGNSSVGKCLIKLQMKNPKFQKQLQACARTQDGIINMTFLFKNYVGKNTRIDNGNVSKILQKYEDIEDIFRKLMKIPNSSYASRSQTLILQEEVYSSFQQIAKDLRQTLAQSLVVLSNLNPEQIKGLIDDQMVLIDLLNKIYYNINDNTIYAGICWQIVNLIMKRGEFYLQNIGFVGFDKTNEIIYQKKKDTAIKYQNILYKYFLIALNNQGSSFRNAVNASVDAFIAYCYIKIPPFRQKIIDSIQKAYDQDIIQFKLEQLQTFTQEMSSMLKNNKDRTVINLHWDKYFYDQIKGNSQNDILEKQVLQEIQNSQWIQQISKRQDTFFNFTAQLVKRLNEITSRTKSWKWSYFPGYTKIVRGFMVQMKKRKIMDYPQIMIKTSTQLLANEELVNVLMPIIVEKTNAFNKLQVIRCISILQNFFNGLSENQTKPLPRTFNYLYFFKSFKLIIESIEHTEAIVKMLILIYDFYEWMSPEWRDNITMYLLGKVFFKLFFHWSYQIRIIFYNFLIIKVRYIRIQQMSKLPSNLQSKQMNTKIAQRYQQIGTILTNAQQQKKQDILDYRTIFQRDIFKKMKNKLRKRREHGYQLNPHKKTNSTKAPSLKQNQSKSNQRFSLQNLLIVKPGGRKNSLPQDEIRNRSSTQFNFKKFDQNENQRDDSQQQKRVNSFCIDLSTKQNSRKLSTDLGLQSSRMKPQQDDQNSLDQILDMKIHRSGNQNKVNGRMGRLLLDLKNVNTKLNYNIYNRQDHELTEISHTQVNYISKGIQEYRDTLIEINKYYQKKGQLPKRELQIQPFLSDQV